MRLVYCITQLDVVIDSEIPVPPWSLSERGKERMKRLLAKYCSCISRSCRDSLGQAEEITNALGQNRNPCCTAGSKLTGKIF